MKTFSSERTNYSLPPPPEINIVNCPRQKQYPTCNICGIIFKKEIDLRKHMDKERWEHYTNIKYNGCHACVECCLFYKTEKAFLQHIGKVHEIGEKSSECVACGKFFKNKYAVKFHHKQVHEKSTRKNCPYCGKEFYSKYLIPGHIRRCESVDDFNESYE